MIFPPDYIVMPRKDGHWDALTMSMINTIRFYDATKDQELVATKAEVMSELDLDDLDLGEIFL